MAGWYLPPPDLALRIKVAIGTGHTSYSSSGRPEIHGMTRPSVISVK
jgi:hypothetical protein